MTNFKVLKSIFNNHSIKDVVILDETDSFTFVISGMDEHISLNRWNNLEKLLNEYLGKPITLISFEQAIKLIGKDRLKKGVVLK